MSMVYFGLLNAQLEPQVKRAISSNLVMEHECPDLPTRRDLVEYTSQGLSWGYYGSRSKQCALALLADALQSDALAIEWHARFADEVVSRMDTSSSPGIVWVIEQTRIQRWLALTENPFGTTESLGHATWLLRRQLSDDDPYVSRALQLLDPEEIRRQDGFAAMSTEDAIEVLQGLTSARESWASLLEELRGGRWR